MRDLVAVTFAANCPVGKNAAYVPGKGKGNWKVLTQKARDFKAAVASAARAAAAEGGWPDPYAVAWCRLEAQSFNSDLDVDAKILLIQDALSGVLYEDDDLVGWGPNDPDGPVFDGGAPWVRVTAVVRALRTPDEARFARAKADRRAENRARKQVGLPPLPPLKPPPALPLL